MARQYSRKKGKSGSKKPIKKTNPSWQRYKPKEIELLTIKLSKSGLTPSQIGLHLRDIYAIPDFKTIMGKSISKFLEEKKLAHELPENLLALIKRSVVLQKHMEENHKDMPGKRGLQLTESKIRRLVTYYKKTKKLSQDWKFDSDNIRLYAE